MDLDDEENQATREANGANKKNKKYQLTIYFIGGTTFSTEFNNIEDVLKFQDLIESKETLKKYNNFIRTFNELEGINVANINAYQIKELEG